MTVTDNHLSHYPVVLQNSHENGSAAAIQILLVAVIVWELLYHCLRALLRLVLRTRPHWILANQHTDSLLEHTKLTLLQRGPSYAVSLLHSLYATLRGGSHLMQLWKYSPMEKLLIPPLSLQTATLCRQAHLQVAHTNLLFLAYLLYDLFHILRHYPILGGMDTVLHHILFATCSLINGTFGIMAFPFGWLAVGECSTIFLNARWFLLKTGREGTLLLNWINALFALCFLVTRNGGYTLGMIHLFWWSKKELGSLSERSGVPVGWLGVTCVCVALGWVLNLVWGYKIWKIVGKSRRKTTDGQNKHH